MGGGHPSYALGGDYLRQGCIGTTTRIEWLLRVPSSCGTFDELLYDLSGFVKVKVHYSKNHIYIDINQ